MQVLQFTDAMLFNLESSGRVLVIANNIFSYVTESGWLTRGIIAVSNAGGNRYSSNTPSTVIGH